MSRFTQRILTHISDRRYTPTRAEELADQLGIAPDELDEFSRTVAQLASEGQVLRCAEDGIALPPPGREMVGIFRKASRGFGFIVPESPVEHGDLFVPAHMTLNAFTGDRVRAKVQRDDHRASAGTGKSPYIGRIIEILQRAQNRFVGNLRKLGSHWVVDVDGQTLREPVIVRDAHTKSKGSTGPKPGEKVVIEMLEYPRDDKPAVGVIVEVLGEQGQPDVETLGVMRGHGLKDGFSETVLADARTAAQSFSDGAVPADRVDLTGELIITIDPPDAKDYDDAISIRRLDQGSRGHDIASIRERDQKHPIHPAAVWELGVHIAHVAHFVKRGSGLDEEAYQRGNSTYLPRKVVPMLPEVLSNGVCSLQEGVNRFCLSVFLTYDAQGQRLSQHFARTVIRSGKRLTYLEAQALIEGELREAIKHARSEPKYSKPVLEAVKQMNDLARTLRARRFKDGMIVLGLPEVELVFDDSGRVVDAVKEDDAFTHTLIEMFMVEANEAAARVFANLDVPMIRRVHADPPVHDLSEMRSFAKVAGHDLPARPTRFDLQRLLDGTRGKPAQYAVHLAVLKTLARAEYAPDLVGHFALASEHYTHFTSPIRRYPDLVVHRGLDAYLDALQEAGGSSIQAPTKADLKRMMMRLRDDPRLPSEDSLRAMGKHCSQTERNSAAAEDDLRTYLVLDLLRHHMGEDYEGTVTGITADGLYVQLDKYLVDGYIKSSDLPGGPADRWRLNRQTGALVAMRSGKSIRIGDRYVVRIANVNPVRRYLEIVIISQVGQPVKERRQTLPDGARKVKEELIRLKRDRRKDKHRKGRR